MVVVDLDETKLRSVNNKYTIARGRLILNKVYRDFKTLIEQETYLNTRGYKVLFDKDQFLSVTIRMETYLDIDNPVKAIIDGVFKVLRLNDKMIVKLLVLKKPHKRNKPGFLYVEVNSYGGLDGVAKESLH